MSGPLQPPVILTPEETARILLARGPAERRDALAAIDRRVARENACACGGHDAAEKFSGTRADEEHETQLALERLISAHRASTPDDGE